MKRLFRAARTATNVALNARPQGRCHWAWPQYIEF